MSATAVMDHARIKQLCKDQKKNVGELLVLSRNNDPFFVGTECQKCDAEWFLDIWKRFGFGTGVHLRRIHYRVAVDEMKTLMPSGAPYENSEACWDYLGSASKAARYLGLVDPAAFVDRRNPDPKIYATSREPVVPGWSMDEPRWGLPSIDIHLESELDLPMPDVDGYDYEPADQRYHLEIWIEKSTMDDVLDPICKRRGVDLITGVGFQSITSVITLLRQRVMVHRKPTRIFYISDFDPAGDQMPVATARQTEYWLNKYAPGMDIKLTLLALTKGQVIEYRLPRIPIKESDLRKKGFEDRHGEGAVELDALEALYPGELAKIVVAAIKPYFDSDLEWRLGDASLEADKLADEEWVATIEEEADHLEELRVEADAITRKFHDRATELKRDFDAEMAPLAERLEAIRHAIQDKAAEFQVDLPPRPDAEQSDADESEWLFSSSRSYLEQLHHYRRHQGGATGEARPRKRMGRPYERPPEGGAR